MAASPDFPGGAALMRAAAAQGAQLRRGQVGGIAQRAGRARGVVIDGAVIEGDAVVIAMGPWSILAAAWVPLPAVFGLKGHSLVFDTGTRVPGEAAFLEYREADGSVLAHELFPRPDGTTYVCGADRAACCRGGARNGRDCSRSCRREWHARRSHEASISCAPRRLRRPCKQKISFSGWARDRKRRQSAWSIGWNISVNQYD